MQTGLVPAHHHGGAAHTQNEAQNVFHGNGRIGIGGGHAGKAVLRFHDVLDLHAVAEVPHHLVVGILNFLQAGVLFPPGEFLRHTYFPQEFLVVRRQLRTLLRLADVDVPHADALRLIVYDVGGGGHGLRHPVGIAGAEVEHGIKAVSLLMVPDDLLHLAVIVHGFRQLIGGIQYLPGYEEGYQGSPIRLFLHAGRVPKQLDSVFFQFLVGHTCFLSYCGHFPLSGAALNGKWYRMVAMPGELRLIERSRTSLHYTPQSAFRPVCRKSCRHRRWRRRRRGSRQSG